MNTEENNKLILDQESDFQDSQGGLDHSFYKQGKLKEEIFLETRQQMYHIVSGKMRVSFQKADSFSNPNLFFSQTLVLIIIEKSLSVKFLLLIPPKR